MSNPSKVWLSISKPSIISISLIYFLSSLFKFFNRIGEHLIEVILGNFPKILSGTLVIFAGICIFSKYLNSAIP